MSIIFKYGNHLIIRHLLSNQNHPTGEKKKDQERHWFETNRVLPRELLLLLRLFRDVFGRSVLREGSEEKEGEEGEEGE
jgi:hypothetical protein